MTLKKIYMIFIKLGYEQLALIRLYIDKKEKLRNEKWS